MAPPYPRYIIRDPKTNRRMVINKRWRIERRSRRTTKRRRKSRKWGKEE